MTDQNIQLITLEEATASAFFDLIERNRDYIADGFPRTVNQVKSLTDAESLFKEYEDWQDHLEGFYFFIKEENSLIGHMHIKNINNYASKCELGYFIDKEYAGMGITSKSINQLLDFCYDKLEMNKVYICTNPENVGSQKVALKNGFIKEGVLREEYKYPNGDVNDVVYFGKLKSEHQSAKTT
ncbi:GNAT family N-acetyltransferase [Spongiivirga citrea]|uniref:GNAT family N-acetyltransferase n=1 Tax=Spongiivirga citrea TaxID=1481457 RepID=A0A6M0CME1_9FLAO|nr:GNAT family protein [Spongiivirga citrea]NER19081.1 GNAT family N-acetyltransferase [Spongiivirga citrea]